MSPAAKRASLIWLLLSCATILSWLLGGETKIGGWAAGTTILCIALLKVATILFEYMELRHAPRAWQAIFVLWLSGLGALLIALFVIAENPTIRAPSRSSETGRSPSYRNPLVQVATISEAWQPTPLSAFRDHSLARHRRRFGPTDQAVPTSGRAT